MKTAKDLRRENILALINNKFAHLSDGRQAGFANFLGKSQSQVSQWLNPGKNPLTGKLRGVGDVVAREIEEKCEMPPGWLDQDHSGEPVQFPSPPAPVPEPPAQPDADQAELLRLFELVPEPARADVLRVVRALAAVGDPARIAAIAREVVGAALGEDSPARELSTKIAKDRTPL